MCICLNFYRKDDSKPWISLLPIWMTACLLLFYWTISTFFVVFCLNAILISTVLGLGAMNLCWQPSVILETFLKTIVWRYVLNILFSCVLSTVFQRLKWNEVNCVMMCILVYFTSLYIVCSVCPSAVWRINVIINVTRVSRVEKHL